VKIAVVRYETKPEYADENQRLVQDVYAELAATAPDGLRYATFRLGDGVTFVHVAITDTEENPLQATTAFAEFQREFGDRVVGSAEVADAVLVGEYRG
jgi:hypothetical protein